MLDHPGLAHHGDLLTSQSSAEGGDHETYPLRYSLSPNGLGQCQITLRLLQQRVHDLLA
jgi:hypothetical protein